MPFPDLCPRRQRLFSSVPATLQQLAGPEHERSLLARIADPMTVPSRRAVTGCVDRLLACSQALENHTMCLDPNGRDPDHLHVEDAEIAALEEAQRRWEVSVEHLLVALVAGGRPPRRWTVRRWARRLARLRRYLRDGARHGAHPRTALGSFWAPAPVHTAAADEPWAPPLAATGAVTEDPF